MCHSITQTHTHTQVHTHMHAREWVKIWVCVVEIDEGELVCGCGGGGGERRILNASSRTFLIVPFINVLMRMPGSFNYFVLLRSILLETWDLLQNTHHNLSGKGKERWTKENTLHLALNQVHWEHGGVVNEFSSGSSFVVNVESPRLSALRYRFLKYLFPYGIWRSDTELPL